MLIALQFAASKGTTTTADESFTTAHLFIDLLVAAANATIQLLLPNMPLLLTGHFHLLHRF
jgi:hypothetical protein